MTKLGDFPTVIGNFDASLDKWQNDLARAKADRRYVKAALLHVEQSRKWIKPILDNPAYAGIIRDAKTIKFMEDATVVVGNPKGPPRKNAVTIACIAIDKAIDCTYNVYLAADTSKAFKKQGGFVLGKPLTYEKALNSVLPGDPDFPTDDSGEDTKSDLSTIK
jgi:hypothetical protein